MPLRFNVANNGESYGRGRVEEFIGDLTSLEGLYEGPRRRIRRSL